MPRVPVGSEVEDSLEPEEGVSEAEALEVVPVVGLVVAGALEA
jgi:hypothetical protein